MESGRFFEERQNFRRTWSVQSCVPILRWNSFLGTHTMWYALLARTYRLFVKESVRYRGNQWKVGGFLKKDRIFEEHGVFNHVSLFFGLKLLSWHPHYVICPLSSYISFVCCVLWRNQWDIEAMNGKWEVFWRKTKFSKKMGGSIVGPYFWGNPFLAPPPLCVPPLCTYRLFVKESVRYRGNQWKVGGFLKKDRIFEEHGVFNHVSRFSGETPFLAPTLCDMPS